jgi:RNA polymerase-binding transcription factor DksA
MPRSTRLPATPAKARARAATPARKAAPKKPASKRTAPKKAVTKKGAAKRPTSKQTARRNVAPKKAGVKKPATKTSAAKKPVAKRAATKKLAPKKPVTKKTAAARAKAPARKLSALAASPAPARAAKAKPVRSPYDAKFLDAQRELLLEERETYTRQAASFQAEADALVNDYEPGDVQFDEESGEGDTLAVERERDLALSAQARQAIAEIDHALAKIGAGTYGVCEVSGLAIPKERLKAIPWARERVEYKAAGIGRL